MEPDEEARRIEEVELVLKAMRLKELKAEAVRLAAEIDEHLKDIADRSDRRG